MAPATTPLFALGQPSIRSDLRKVENAEVQRLVARGFSQARLVRLVLARRRLRTSAVVSELFAEFRHRCSAALGTDVVRADPHHPQAGPILAHAVARGYIVAGSEAARLCEQQDQLDRVARESGGLRHELDQARQRAEEAERLAAAADAARREQEAQQSQEARRQQEARREAATRAGEMAELRRERDRAVARRQ